MSDLDDLQHRVGEWGKQTFPHSTRYSIIEQLKREVEELEAGCCNRHDREECADVLLLLLHLAHRFGFSLIEEAEHKFAVCQTREGDRSESRQGADTKGVSEPRR